MFKGVNISKELWSNFEESAIMYRLGRNAKIQKKYREISKIAFAVLFACNLITSVIFVILYTRCFKTIINCDQVNTSNSNNDTINSTSFTLSAEYAMDLSLYEDNKNKIVYSSLIDKMSCNVCSFCTWFKRKNKRTYNKQFVFKYFTLSSNISLFFQNGYAVVTLDDKTILSYVHHDFSNNEWNHICIMIDSAQIELYLNGKLEKQTNLSEKKLFSEVQRNFLIGSGNYNDTFQGELSQFLIYNKKLSSKELLWSTRFNYSNDQVLLGWSDVLLRFSYLKIPFSI
ncbi:uncharacterized protein LOC105846518 [Hydra vulgaris]|uniref:Uncharacterized protein LOC105846518 n=1 Tax=Hydra vulgaris TaxID=6087 RepID=A0ABM4CVF8_HYDVU